MNAQKRYCLMALCLLTGLGQGSVQAAAIFDPDTQPVGYVGMPEVSSNIVTLGTQRLYAIDYSSQNWSGNLHSYPLSSTGGISALDDWTGGAAKQIDLQNATSGTWNPTGRLIVTMNGSTGVPFDWANLSASQKSDLDPDSAALVSSPVLNYIRGDRSNETPDGKKYRARSTVLGDIVHSTPVYWNDGTNATVFVGANDGMLHAVNAANGSERFAYIPSMLIPKLANLKADPYVHKYFVDGRMDVRKFGSTTILVGSLGAGGKGLFALDVTNTAATNEPDAASKVRWEITPSTSGFANLGYTYGQPVLATVGSTAVAIVGNGYNNAGNGQASLFVINATTGALIAELGTGSGSAASPNGLSSPTVVDVDVDGKADYAYAGDIDGNLWKFDLSTNAVTKLHTTDPAQAITMAPGIKSHPHGGFMVTFATGRMFTSGSNSDETDTATHYAYGIWDRPGAYAANDTLLEQTLTEAEYTGVTPSIRVRTASNNSPVWTAGADNHKGWKTALPIGGERVIGDGAYVTGSVFLFMSTNPTVDPTATPPGENWWMQLNALTGGDNGSIRFDLDGDNAFTQADRVDGDINPVGRFMGGGVRSQLTALSASGLDVYQSNYDKNGDPPPSPPVSAERGVSGGHFDFDVYCYSANCNNKIGASAGTYYTGSNTDTVNKGLMWTHVHEYDDIYDVTGVNMLNASQSLLNLGKALGVTTTSTSSTSVTGNFPAATTTTTTVTYPTDASIRITKVTVTTTVTNERINKVRVYTTTTTTKTEVTNISGEFKILMANQAYSPAAKITVGGGAYVNITGFGTASELTAASLPSYNIRNIGSLAVNLPLDAFKSKNWGTGVVRAGLHPVKWSCVVSNPTSGPLGERRNGALLIQIVKSSVADSDIQLNVSGRPDLGYRLKNSSMSSKLLAEYTMFWHHPNDKCMADSGWIMAPPEDHESDARAATPAPGSADPADGIFSVGPPDTGPLEPSDPTDPTNPADPTDPSGGGSTGGGVSVGVETGGVVSSGGAISLGGVTTPPEVLGRVNWRELRQ